MYRESMSEMSGMLFVFEIADIYDFRMKNTLIPLDMLWIDENFNVVKIHTAEPCTADPCPIYQPGKTAKYVLETEDDITSQKAIRKYFETLYYFQGEGLDKKRILEQFHHNIYPFATVAKEFKLIEQNTKSIFISKE